MPDGTAESKVMYKGEINLFDQNPPHYLSVVLSEVTVVASKITLLSGKERYLATVTFHRYNRNHDDSVGASAQLTFNLYDTKGKPLSQTIGGISVDRHDCLSHGQSDVTFVQDLSKDTFERLGTFSVGGFSAGGTSKCGA